MSDEASGIITIEKVINVESGPKLSQIKASLSLCDFLMVNQIYPFKIQGYFLIANLLQRAGSECCCC